jgi:hypothetical protein
MSQDIMPRYALNPAAVQSQTQPILPPRVSTVLTLRYSLVFSVQFSQPQYASLNSGLGLPFVFNFHLSFCLCSFLVMDTWWFLLWFSVCAHRLYSLFMCPLCLLYFYKLSLDVEVYSDSGSLVLDNFIGSGGHFIRRHVVNECLSFCALSSYGCSSPKWFHSLGIVR